MWFYHLVFTVLLIWRFRVCNFSILIHVMLGRGRSHSYGIVNLISLFLEGPRRHPAEQYEEPASQYAHQHHNLHHRNQSQFQEYDRGGSGRVQSHPLHSNSNPHLKRPAAVSHYDGSPRAQKYAAVSSSDQPSTIVRSNLRQIQCVDDPVSQQGTSRR